MKDYPKDEDEFQFNDKMSDTKVQKLCLKLLKRRKGDSYAARLTEYCTEESLPKIVKEVLYGIHTSMQQENHCHFEGKKEVVKND